MYNRLLSKYLHLILYVCILIILSGCKGNDFKLLFELPQKINKTYMVTYYASDPQKGWLVDGAATMQKGKCEFAGQTYNPTLLYLTSTGQYPLIIYIERGNTMKITGVDGDPYAWQVSGNKISEELSAWINANANLLARGDRDGVNLKIEQYLKSNPDNPIAAILLYNYYDSRDNRDNFEKLRSSLKGEAASDDWAQMSGRLSVYADSEATLKTPSMMVLNTMAKPSDTIYPGKVPTILYFTKNNIDSYDRDIQIIRVLSREYSDSSKRLIVDINFEPDSASRTYKAKSDSLRNVVRAWMPLGVSDRYAVRLGVERLPYAVVIDKGGKVKYRGGDISQAATTFRGISK